MRKANPRKQKNDVINIRISAQEKQRFIAEAEAMNMNLSRYVLHLLRHKEIISIDCGVELAKAIFQCNQHLNQIGRSPNVPVQKLRNAITQEIKTITACIDKTKRGGNPHVCDEVCARNAPNTSWRA